MNATLRELVLAVRYGDASLVGESVGYIVLGAADRAATVARRADLDSVLLTGEGEVALDATACTPLESEASLRALLKSLLSLVRAHCPNLERVAQRPGSAGLPHLVTELEAALVPVNRKAARRPLSRLVREARRSAAQASVHRAVLPVMAQQGDGAEPAAWTSAPEAKDEVPSEPEVSEQAPRPEARMQPEPRAVASAPPQLIPPAVPVPLVEEASFPGEEAPVSVWGARSVFAPLPLDPFDDALTVVRAEVAEVSQAQLAVSPEVDHPAEPVTGPGTSLAPPRDVWHLGTAPEPFQPSTLGVRGREIPEETPLIEGQVGAQVRRPSDASELLEQMRVVGKPSEDLYRALQALSRVDLSPAAPLVG